MNSIAQPAPTSSNIQSKPMINSNPLLSDYYCKSFDTPDEIKRMEQNEHYLGKVLHLPNGSRVCYSILQPGFSVNSCNMMHLGYVLQGKLRVTSNNNAKTTKLFVKGEIFFIPPGHSTTVEGNEAVHAIELRNFYDLQQLANLDTFQKNILNDADEVRKLPSSQINMMNLTDQISFGMATFKPGWKWSKDIKPIARTDSCEHSHLLYTIAGEMKLIMPDGEKILTPGNIIFIPPGHDAEVIGNNDVIMLDFGSTKNYGVTTQHLGTMSNK